MLSSANKSGCGGDQEVVQQASEVAAEAEEEEEEEDTYFQVSHCLSISASFQGDSLTVFVHAFVS